jgi:hypothetical protein
MLAMATVGIYVSGCSTPAKMTSNDLASIGVVEGVSYWQAEQKLAGAGYHCFVTGAKRENFDCTRTTGVFPTCVLRVTFSADDKNLVSQLRVANPACVGSP